ncbi:VIN3-like protein 1, partial [Olea europaea var. sylvestris]|uniref:VIN3-like protein 1 n=1 Tax=Olea europaea var. sylvestris TaxID=158386 RepID=UPI000C1D3158
CRYWKKQLTIAKDARRVDILCYRIFLSYRLLEGTSIFNALHQIVKEAKEKLEPEVGPLNDSAKMARGIVSRLSVAGDVQALCSLAIEKADGLLASKCSTSLDNIESSLPAACKFVFEEIASSSVLVKLIEISTAPFDDIEGFKLWYCKTREENYTKEPVKVFPRSQRTIWISNLQPCTEYSFRIVSFAEAGELGHSVAKCFTKSIEIIHKNSNPLAANLQKENSGGGISGAKRDCKTVTDIETDSAFKVQDLGKNLRLAWAQEQGVLQGFRGADVKICSGDRNFINPETVIEDRLQSIPREIDLNVSSVPDLNEEFTPPVESSRDNWNHTKTDDGPAVDSRVEACPKMAHNTNVEMQDSVSNLTNGSPSQAGNVSGSLDENFEYCVKIVRWLECEGHVTEEFRKKFLTWFSLRSSKQERRVVQTFIKTLMEDPSSLAEQLVDSFSEIIAVSGQRSRELWH